MQNGLGVLWSAQSVYRRVSMIISTSNRTRLWIPVEEAVDTASRFHLEFADDGIQHLLINGCLIFETGDEERGL